MGSALAPAPCKLCPFRKDVPIYLRKERREEIAMSLAEGGTFSCHSTVDYDTDVQDEEGFDVPSTANSKFCAGAVKAMLLDGQPNQMLRIILRIWDA